MSHAQWKVAERRLAALFGTKRRPLSGKNHGTGRGDDSFHDRFYLESKYGQNVTLVRNAWDLYTETKAKAKAETKDHIPVIGLQRTSRPGILLLIHSSNLEDFCREYIAQIEGTKASSSSPAATASTEHTPACQQLEPVPEVSAVPSPPPRRPIPRPRSSRRIVHRRSPRPK